VATAAGVLIAFDWRLGIGALAVWLAIAVLTRYSSLAAIVAAGAAPVAAWYIGDRGSMLVAVIVMGGVLIARHHANISKLLRGEESRIGEKKNSVEGTPKVTS
jgi:glycerol-3-phosphate acyltransferase PlsY